VRIVLNRENCSQVFSGITLGNVGKNWKNMDIETIKQLDAKTIRQMDRISFGQLINAIKQLTKCGLLPYIVDSYIVEKLPRTDKFYAMTNGSGYVPQHRIVMARMLGRCLRSDEIVHHVNGKKTDNRLTNLLIMDKQTHRRIHNKSRLTMDDNFSCPLYYYVDWLKRLDRPIMPDDF